MIKDKKIYNILIVEDNPGIFLLITDYLRRHIHAPNIVHTQSFKETKNVLKMR